jgi:protease-4
MEADPKPRQVPRNPKTTRLLLGITLLGGLVFVASIASLAWLINREDAGEVKEGSFLRLHITGALPDAPPPPGLFDDPNKVRPTGVEVAAALRKAASDERIDGLYLTIDGMSASWAMSTEVRSGIEAMRTAGKPCVAYSEVWTTGAWYLASACDHVVMPPGGIGMVTGLDARTTYYAGIFEKLGIQPQMLHVGDFKSAVEPYERAAPSEPASEAMNYLLDGLWGQFIADAARGRNVAPSVVQELIDRPTLSPGQSLQRGLVDALAYPDALIEHLDAAGTADFVARVTEASAVAGSGGTETPKEKTEEDDRFTSMGEYVKGLRSDWGEKDAQIALIYAAGPIMSGESDGGLFGDASLTDRSFREWIRAAAEDENVKAIVLRVESPGGSGLASDMMWREIRKAQVEEGKPVVVSMGGYAASGGYYIAAPADWIVAQPTTLTGSIGVFGGKLNLGGAYEKLGLTQHSYKRGEQADLLAMTVGFSDGGRETYQTFLDEFYELFLTRVTEGRELSRDDAHAVAQGRVWTGTQALERGLVDELGGLDVALAKAAELAELDSYGVSQFPKQKNFFELIQEDLEAAAFSPQVEVSWPAGLGPDVAKELEDLRVLDSVLRTGPAAMLPGGLRIEAE